MGNAVELTWLQLTSRERTRALKAWQDGTEMEEFFAARGTKKEPYRQLIALQKALHQCDPWARRLVHFDDALKGSLLKGHTTQIWTKRERAYAVIEQLVSEAVAVIPDYAGRKTEWRYHELAAELRNIWVEHNGSPSTGQRPDPAAGLKANALVKFVASGFAACDGRRLGGIKSPSHLAATAENKAWAVLRALPKLDDETRQ